MGLQPAKQTIRLAIPGLNDLHTRTAAEIAEVLTVALRSQKNVVEIKYVVGQYIELTYVP